MKVWLVALRCVSEQCELGDAEDVAVDVFHARFPHLAIICRVVEDAEVEAESWVRTRIDGRGLLYS